MENEVLTTLIDAGYEAYICGGAVRDILLGKSPKDIDICTNAMPEQIQALFPKTLAVGAAFGTIVVVTDEGDFEVTTFRSDLTMGRHPEVKFGCTSRDDVMRRDFTVNGLLMDDRGHIHDMVGGLGDVECKIIRCIGDANKRFQEDPLRMMRALRFACNLGFAIEPDTMDAITINSGLLSEISNERIRDELDKGFALGKNPAMYFTLLSETGLMKHCIPELYPLQTCMQSPDHHPEGDVWIHTMLMLDGCKGSGDLSWACLLHDIGKPACKKVVPGKITFHGHNDVGAVMALEIMGRLKFSNDRMDQIATVIRNHMDHMCVREMKNHTFKKYISRPTHALELELHGLDAMASNGDMSTYEFIIKRASELPAEEINPPALITGKDLIAAGKTPGPQFKEILDRVRDAQLDGVVTTKEEALAMI
jgi:poly(A) polymerase